MSCVSGGGADRGEDHGVREVHEFLLVVFHPRMQPAGGREQTPPSVLDNFF
jgi:hypothetical protein